MRDGDADEARAGMLTLSGVSGMSGNTTVSAGTLLVSGSLANSAVTVASGATLMGDGPVGNLTVSGTVDPGNSVGARAALACGALTLNAGGAMKVDISKAAGTAGTDWDLLSAGAIAANASGTFTVYLSGAPSGFSSTAGYSWKIMSGTSVANFDAGRFAVDASGLTATLDGGSFSVSQLGNDIYVNFAPRVPDAPAALTATATGPTSIQLGFTRNGNSDPVVIVFDLDGTFTHPSGTIPAVGQPFAGGTVVYAGGTSPQNHSGLTGCQTYFYKAWSYNGTSYSTSGATASGTTDTPAAPTGLAGTNIGEEEFTATWNASAGATSYRLDVSLYENFATGGGGGGGTNHFIQSFTELASSYTDGNVTLSNQTWNVFQVYGEASTASYGGVGKAARINDDTVEAHVTTPEMNTLGYVLFYYRELNTGGGEFLVQKSINGGAWSTISTTAYSGATYTMYSNSVNDASTNIKIRVVSDNNPGHLIIDEMQCTSYSTGAATPSYVPGYSNLLVSSTSSAVTGLVGNTTYYFRVRAVGADASCVSSHSSVSNVTTESAIPAAPAAFSATATGVSSIQLAFTKNANGSPVVIVRNTTGTFTTPTGGIPAAGGDFAGGTVVYKGDTSPQTDSGLDACTRYYYKAWSYKGDVCSETGLTADATTSSPGAPTSIWVNPTNYTDFTLNWGTVAGASGYRVDVSTNADFSGGGLVDDFTDGDFSNNLVWSGNTSAFMILTDSTLPDGSAATDGSFLGVDGTNAYSALTTPCEEVSEWKFSLGSPDFAPSSANYFGVVLMASAPFSGDIAASNFQGYYLKIGVDGSTDYIELWRKTGSGSTKVGDFSAAGNFGTGALKDGLNIRVTRSASGEFTLYYSTGFTYAAEPTNNGGTLTNNVYGTSSYFGIYGRFANNGTSRRIYFDNFQTGTGGGGGFVSGYADRPVAGTTLSVQDLEENTTYYYRVRTEGAGGCTSDHSSIGSVTTKTGRLPPTAFTATPVSPSQIDLAFTKNAGGDNVVIVFNTTGVFESPATAPPAVGQSFAGGTLIYNGTGTGYSHTSLSACTKYYYRAWSYAASAPNWSKPVNTDATTPAPAAPASVWESLVGYTEFTANWSASSGATGYYIDVSESPTFSGSSGASTRVMVASNAAASAAAISGEWSGQDIEGTSYVTMKKATSEVISPAFSTVNFTNLTVDFRGRTYGGVNAAYNLITVSISTNDGVNWDVIGTSLPTSSTMGALPTLTTTSYLGYAQTRIRWQTLGANGSVGAGIDRLVVQGWEAQSSTPAFVPGYENLSVGNVTSYQINGLDELTTYYFRVRATAGSDCTSANSGTGQATTKSGSPLPPTNVAATDGTHLDKVVVTWTDGDEEHGYTIWRHTIGTPGAATVIGSTASNVVQFDDTTAAPGMLYYYWVTASNNIGSSAKGAYDTGYRRLSAPANVAASDGTSAAHVAITWSDVTGATSYRIFRHTSDTPAEGMANLGAQLSGYLDTSATPGQKYWYWVVAEASSSASTSAWGVADSGYRRLAEVPMLAASYDEYNDKIALSWADVLGETGYGIWRHTVNDPLGATSLAEVLANTLAYDDTTATPGVEYFYWVTATNSTSASMGPFQANGALGRQLDPNLPIVLTDTPSGITSGSANGGGNVLNEGNSEILLRGVVWATHQNPTTADAVDYHAEGGPGTFTNYMSGLIAGGTYYVRAFASNETGIAYGPQKSFQTPCFSGVVTGLFVNPTNGMDFMAQWAPMPGAASYRLDVSTNEYFLEGSSVGNVISESFAGFTALNGTTDRSGALDTYMQTTGWTGQAVYENQGEVKMGASSTMGFLITPSLNLAGNAGQATLSFDARRYGADTTTIFISIAPDGVNFVQCGSSYTLTSDMTTYTHSLTGCTATTKVKISATVASSKRYYLDNFLIQQGSGQPSYLTGYSNLLVSGTSQKVEGLVTNSWYYFRVRAESPHGCLSGNSATEAVQTRDLSPQGPPNLQASDGTSADYVHVSWDDVPIADRFVIYRNVLDEFDTSTAIWTNTRAGAVLLQEDFVDFSDWTDGGTANDTDPTHYGAASPCRALGVDDTLTSPTVHFPTQLTFYVDASGTGAGNWTTNYYSLDGGATWTALGTFQVTMAGATVTQDLTALPDLSNAESVKFRFVSAFNTWYLDDVVVTGGRATDFYDTTAVPGLEYWYFAVATNAYGANVSLGDSGWRAMAAVQNVQASDGTSTDYVNVTWNTLSGGETGYSIWRALTDSTEAAECVGWAADNHVSITIRARLRDSCTGTAWATNETSNAGSWVRVIRAGANCLC